MIVRQPHVELAEFEHVHYVDTRIVAVALARVDGADVEPLLLTVDDNGELRIEAEVVLPLGIDLHAIFGGVRFQALPESTRARIVRIVSDRAIEAFRGSDAL